MGGPRELRIDVQRQSIDVYVIRVDGELNDAGDCLYLDLALRDVEGVAAAKEIILDLERVTSIGSNGLRVLVNAGRRSAGDGNRLQMTRGNGHLSDMLRLTALDQPLPVADPSLVPAILDR